MTCISTAAFSVSVNGEVLGFFRGKRGIRQGDPISPYIFVLVMEYFTRCMRKMGKDPNFRFHPGCKELRIISMCFADDLMIFLKAHDGSLKILKNWLLHFERASGLSTNVSKSALSFGGVGPEKQAQLAGILGFCICPAQFNYLGVPLTAKKLRVELYQPLLDKMLARINCWSSKFLSYSGRLQLVKSVLMSVQLYWSQIFLIPKAVIMKVEGLCRSFLWTGSALGKHRALVKWDEVCMDKKFGGLGVLRVWEWNVASLFKLVWDLAKKADRLWIKWIHARYLRTHSVWTVQRRDIDPWCWKSLLRVRDSLLPFVSLLADGGGCILGDAALF
ncbi:hypothetical protein Dimus_038972 [Dionaea muscipula]